jgi:hypothetical protein
VHAFYVETAVELETLSPDEGTLQVKFINLLMVSDC